ncbi:MAG: ChbG/HpnK family deacetylase [Acidimicrobiia bacterium]|nr:ChbG/HpnK family deacetylase [Acidimicrobiia bacterium]
MSRLLDLLGYGPTDRLVIITCHGLGSSNAANHAIHTALRHGVATSAELQIPCPWSRAAAAQHHGEDVGLSLTFLAEHDLYRWGPITNAPSLLDGDGGFPRTAADLGEHADVEEVRREGRAQIERAILWGFDLSHLSSHLQALCLRPELFDVYLELAVEFQLPIGLPRSDLDLGYPAHELAAEENVLTPDHVVAAPWSHEARPVLDDALRDLRPGVTELQVRPAIDTPEIRSVAPHWPAYVSDAHLVSSDWTFRAALGRSGALPIGYRSLRDAQRKL